MGLRALRPCPCGSGLLSCWQRDARGIELCRTCAKCHDEKMARYRPDVLTDSNYRADEPIEPDDEIVSEPDEDRLGFGLDRD